MKLRDLIEGAAAGVAIVLIAVPAGALLGTALAEASIALSDLVAPCGDVSPVHHDDRNIR